MEGAGRLSFTKSPRGGAASAIETGRTKEKPLTLPASPQTAPRCPQGFLGTLQPATVQMALQHLLLWDVLVPGSPKTVWAPAHVAWVGLGEMV